MLRLGPGVAHANGCIVPVRSTPRPSPHARTPQRAVAPATLAAPPVLKTPAASNSESGTDAPPPTCIISLAVKHAVPFGQTLRVCGSADCLGAWNLDAAPRMEWHEGDEWTLWLEWPLDEAVEFKLVQTNFDNTSVAVWQDGDNARLELSESSACTKFSMEFDSCELTPLEQPTPIPAKNPRAVAGPALAKAAMGTDSGSNEEKSPAAMNGARAKVDSGSSSESESQRDLGSSEHAFRPRPASPSMQKFSPKPRPDYAERRSGGRTPPPKARASLSPRARAVAPRTKDSGSSRSYSTEPRRDDAERGAAGRSRSASPAPRAPSWRSRRAADASDAPGRALSPGMQKFSPKPRPSYAERRSGGRTPPPQTRPSSMPPRPTTSSYRVPERSQQRAPAASSPSPSSPGTRNFSPKPRPSYAERRSGGRTPPPQSRSASLSPRPGSTRSSPSSRKITPKPRPSYAERRSGGRSPSPQSRSASLSPRPAASASRDQGRSRSGLSPAAQKFTPKPRPSYAERRTGGRTPPPQSRSASLSPRPASSAFRPEDRSRSGLSPAAQKFTPKPRPSYAERRSGGRTPPPQSRSASLSPRPASSGSRSLTPSRSELSPGSQKFTPKPRPSYAERRSGGRTPSPQRRSGSLPSRPPAYTSRDEGQSRSELSPASRKFTPKPRPSYAERRSGGRTPAPDARAVRPAATSSSDSSSSYATRSESAVSGSAGRSPGLAKFTPKPRPDYATRRGGGRAPPANTRSPKARASGTAGGTGSWETSPASSSYDSDSAPRTPSAELRRKFTPKPRPSYSERRSRSR